MENLGLGFKLFEMARLLISADTYHEILDVIVKKSADISCCERSCLIIRNKRNEMVIKAGFPADGHGIGQKIQAGHGEEFLRKVIENGKGSILIVNPCVDPRVEYMKEMAVECGISLVFFAPLFFQREALGILILDYIGKDKPILSKEGRLKIRSRLKIVADFASIIIGKEYKKRQIDVEIRKKEHLVALGENSARIAHIIRNSLTVFDGFLRRLNKKISAGSPVGNVCGILEREYIQIVQNEHKKLKKITNDVLNFSKVSSQGLNLTSCNLNEVLKECKEKLFDFLNKNGIKINIYFNHFLEKNSINLDKEKIEICIQEIFRNATKAGAKRIAVKTKIKAKHGYVVLSIVNNGTNIDPSMLEEIFEPFATTRTDGTGLGLAITRAIIENHKGRISVASDERRTEFKIYLPF